MVEIITNRSSILFFKSIISLWFVYFALEETCESDLADRQDEFFSNSILFSMCKSVLNLKTTFFFSIKPILIIHLFSYQLGFTLRQMQLPLILIPTLIDWQTKQNHTYIYI